MKYKLIERGKPGDKTAPKKWYAGAVNDGKITQKSIAGEIAARSSLTSGDVANVIENVLQLIPKYLVMGKSVSLGDFGTLRLSLSSQGADTPEKFNTSMVKNIKVIFTPGKDIKEAIRKAPLEHEK